MLQGESGAAQRWKGGRGDLGTRRRAGGGMKVAAVREARLAGSKSDGTYRKETNGCNVKPEFKKKKSGAHSVKTNKTNKKNVSRVR